MAQTTPKLEGIIQSFRRQLERMGIRAERIMLFGSHATGSAQEGSDIDLIVVSNDWGDLNQRERLELLGVAAARILEPIQAQGFTSEEIFNRNVTPFWEFILSKQAVEIDLLVT